MAAHLRWAGFKVAEFHGGHSNRKRQSILQNFRSDTDDIQGLVATIGTAGVGALRNSVGTIIYFLPLTLVFELKL